MTDDIPRSWQCDWLHDCQQMCCCILQQTRQTSNKNGVRIFNPDLLVRLFVGNEDDAKESINESGVHVDDVLALLECHAMGDFDVGTIVGVGASTVAGQRWQ